MKKYLRSNQKLWDEKTKVHIHSPFYDLEGFKAGKSSLYPIEQEELAGEVAGKTLLHLQSHFGMDTLSLARLGAKATGVDFSGEAINQARLLNEELGLGCTFIQSDIYDLRQHLKESFDIVFTTYGVLTWLPDLVQWAEVIAHFLNPGGIFFIAEIHPFSYMISYGDKDASMMRVEYPYFYDPEPQGFTPEGTYADPEAEIEHNVQYEWPHELSEILNALTAAGLHINYMHEFDYTVFQQMSFLVPRGRLYHIPEGMPRVPLLFSLRAHKA
jgi:SAM-dependent methyltransferase